MSTNRTKVCYVLSYKSKDYIRTRVLIAALRKLPKVQLYTAINSSESIWRYVQTIWRLALVRLTKHPRIYFLGFRGQEIYWPVRIITLGRPLVFDEFIIMHGWLGEENNKLPNWLIRLADIYEKASLKTCQVILSDSQLDCQSSSQTYNIPIKKYKVIYVGADETVFHPIITQPDLTKDLQVFFYGSMAPLHGIQYILEAAKELSNKPVHFTIVGGKSRTESIKNISNYIKNNSLSNITYFDWLEFNKIPEYMSRCDIFLGGPFGNTSQSKRVITGKTFQALAMAKPTIIGKINESAGFENETNCLIVTQGSSAALANAIIWSINNKSKLKTIGLAAYNLYIDKFSTEQIANQLDLIITSL